MLAKDVNDDAGILDARGAFEPIVGTPPGACSLLHGYNGLNGSVLLWICDAWVAGYCY
jgi:hypothetical protein